MGVETPHFCPECEGDAHHTIDSDELKCSSCGLIFKEIIKEEKENE